MQAEQYHRQALDLERSGNRDEARALLARGLADHGDHPDLLNSAGNMALRAGALQDAIDLFERAAAAGGGRLDYVLNLAIALTTAGRPGEALRRLDPAEPVGAGNPRYWTVRANAAREADDLAGAAASYDRAAGLEPANGKALHGRARMALERGEEDAVARFELALRQDGGNAQLWLGLAQAQEAAGNRDAAREIADQLVRQAPTYIDALTFATGLDGSSAGTDAVFAEAARSQPADPNIPAAWIAALGGSDRYDRAAEVAREAATRFAAIPAFALWEATYLSAAGYLDEADRRFADLPDDLPGADIERARHALRRGDPLLADRLCGETIARDPDNVAAWALRSVAWRLSRDSRIEWLHARTGLVQLLPIEMRGEDWTRLHRDLHALHDRAAFPIGQSLRGGTQTRGRLFSHHLAIFAVLRVAVERAVERYRTSLPPADPGHPLLRHRDVGWDLAGSWSVRLSQGADHHTAHIHPQGVVSSALYVELPGGKPDEGVLELGRPPANLGLDLEPERIVAPREGHAALFPSTLYHGTTAFASGRRLTVAFDIVPGNPGPGAGGRQ